MAERHLGTNPNGFRTRWEMFLRHRVEHAPRRYSLMEGAKGGQLAELGPANCNGRRRIDVPETEG
jgi:hypothetical protein